MEKKISFNGLVKKVGLSEAYFMFWNKIPPKITDKFTFDDWDTIRKNGPSMSLANDDKMSIVYDTILKKMVEKANTLEEVLQAYQLTKNESREELIALEKLSQFKESKKWLEIFDKKSRLFIIGKGLAYLKEKIRDFVDLQ